MDRQRREFVHKLALGSGVCAAAALGLGTTLSAHAASGDTRFKADNVEKILAEIGAKNAKPSEAIMLDTPEVASNGAMVPVEVKSDIPGTDYIALIADNNPFPLLAEFDVMDGAVAYVSARIKMRKTSSVRAVVRANGQFYMADNEVKVTIGGCGG